MDHHYFPRHFRYQVILLLMMRLKRHLPNRIGLLPEPVFFVIIGFLGVSAYEDDNVPRWELDWVQSRQKLLGSTAAVEGAPKKSKK